MKKYHKQRHRLLSLLLCLMMAVTLLGNAIPAYAEGTETVSHNIVPVEISARAELEEAVQRAREAGVILTEQAAVSRTVTPEEADAAKEEVEQDYLQQIAAIEQAIAQQDEYDQAFRIIYTQAITGMLGDEWSLEELEEIISGELTDLSIISPQSPNRMTLTYYQMQSGGTLKKLNRLPTTNSPLRKGDVMHYGNILQNPKDSKWVDLRITVEKMTDSAFYDENGQLAKDVSEEQFLNGNHNPNYGQEVNQVALRGPLNKTKLEFYYGDVDLTLQVEFLDHESQQAVELTPLVVFCDIDGYQGIREHGQALGHLTGSDIIELPNGVLRSDSFVDDEANSRIHYSIYALPPTTTFTYTFYDGAMRGIVQGIGGDHLPVPDPLRQWASASYQFTNLSVEMPEEPTGNLSVTKAVAGEGADQNKEFTFTVTLNDTTITGEYGDMNFTNGVATFTLKHSKSKTATGLPAGVSYAVEESDNNGYTVTSTSETGTIQTGGTAMAAFLNHKEDGGDDPNPLTEKQLTVYKYWNAGSTSGGGGGVFVVRPQSGGGGSGGPVYTGEYPPVEVTLVIDGADVDTLILNEQNNCKRLSRGCHRISAPIR